jgi:hypothetical protein
MESTAAETKVQIRLSTRDASLQIAEEPTVLLVQTCKYSLVRAQHIANDEQRADNAFVVRVLKV